MQNQFFYREFYRRNLPHYQPGNGIFFITTCLAKALSTKIISELKQRKIDFQNMIKKVSENQKIFVLKEFHRSYFRDFESFIHSQSKKDWLIRTSIQQVIKENLLFWDGVRYKLIAFCIMPNHLHLMIKPFQKGKHMYESLSKIMFTMKSFTANECNKILDRSGQFWLHESYDHYIRNFKDYEYHLKYLLENPVKSNLVNKWKDWNGNWLYKDWDKIEI
ncbi:MAG: hypothetical protein K9N09_12215 [Candidatus Cloacimonetes bacterium]|nr:hypothetical protein [Candidatus Cloacimonadota bacterium]MCF7869448.1 hypothetical protein [Candidatus Cloacimonadota bacterium]